MGSEWIAPSHRRSGLLLLLLRLLSLLAVDEDPLQSGYADVLLAF